MMSSRRSSPASRRNAERSGAAFYGAVCGCVRTVRTRSAGCMKKTEQRGQTVVGDLTRDVFEAAAAVREVGDLLARTAGQSLARLADPLFARRTTTYRADGRATTRPHTSERATRRPQSSLAEKIGARACQPRPSALTASSVDGRWCRSTETDQRTGDVMAPASSTCPTAVRDRPGASVLAARVTDPGSPGKMKAGISPS